MAVKNNRSFHHRYCLFSFLFVSAFGDTSIASINKYIFMYVYRAPWLLVAKTVIIIVRARLCYFIFQKRMQWNNVVERAIIREMFFSETTYIYTIRL